MEIPVTLHPRRYARLRDGSLEAEFGPTEARPTRYAEAARIYVATFGVPYKLALSHADDGDSGYAAPSPVWVMAPDQRTQIMSPSEMVASTVIRISENVDRTRSKKG
jgi:hypothetical protein